MSFANRDVANFGEKEVTRFLDNTWKLLPESNPSLRTQGVYSIRSYRVALQGMEGFLRTLDPRTIFARYRDTPPAEEYRRLEKRGERNVTTARAYLGIKLLTAAILEALAEISGGDAPVALFMGDLDARQKGSKLDDYLPSYRPSADLPLDPTLRDLLANGRASASRFDLQNSPLSLFIYLHLGADGLRTHLDAARRVFDGTRAPRGFLDALPWEYDRRHRGRLRPYGIHTQRRTQGLRPLPAAPRIGGAALFGCDFTAAPESAACRGALPLQASMHYSGDHGQQDGARHRT